MYKQVVMYGRETWPMTEKRKIMLNECKRKVLRVYGTETEQGLWESDPSRN
jgi:hypothetical protein